MMLIMVKQVFHLVYKVKIQQQLTIAANVTLNHVKTSSVISELRDSINNYTTTTGVTATLSTDKSSIIMVQNEGYDIKLGDVNFADTSTTGQRRTLLVTSLDNNEVVAGDPVSLGDTNVTGTDADGISTTGGTGSANALTINGAEHLQHLLIQTD